MKRLAMSMMVVGLAVAAGFAVASRVAAAPSPIATAMGDLRWGMSEREVVSFAKRDLGAQYNEQITKTKDSSKQAQLKSQAKSAVSAVDGSLTNFEGGKSRWDSSPIAGEFNYDNSESMLISKGPNGDTYYFFVDGKLWKAVTVVDKHAAGDFKKFSHAMEDKFGKGRLKKGELASGQGNTQWFEYLDRNSRLRVADDSGKRGGFALIYEEMATVRELAKLHPVKKAAAADEEPAPAKEPPANQIAKAPTKRSIFGKENRTENESDYQSRKEKTAIEARERAQRAQSRKEETKKGEVLKQLDTVNDSDPLGGL